MTRWAMKANHKENYMKPNAFAAKLNGMDLTDMPSEMDSEARRAGLVVVLGVSADTIEFHGAMRDEIDVPDGDTIYLDAAGLLPHPDDIEGMSDAERRDYYDRKRLAASIDAEWQKDGFNWTFTTVLPHARFVAHKDGQRYARGIVFAAASLGAK